MKQAIKQGATKELRTQMSIGAYQQFKELCQLQGKSEDEMMQQLIHLCIQQYESDDAYQFYKSFTKLNRQKNLSFCSMNLPSELVESSNNRHP